MTCARSSCIVPLPEGCRGPDDGTGTAPQGHSSVAADGTSMRLRYGPVASKTNPGARVNPSRAPGLFAFSTRGYSLPPTVSPSFEGTPTFGRNHPTATEINQATESNAVLEVLYPHAHSPG